MKFLLVLAPLALMACDTAAPPRGPSVGEEAKAEMDALVAAYDECVVAAAGKADPDGAPPVIADQAFAECAETRASLAAAVLEFRRIGYPTEAETQSQAVAEQSVAVLEQQIRERALVEVVRNQIKAGKAEEGTN